MTLFQSDIKQKKLEKPYVKDEDITALHIEMKNIKGLQHHNIRVPTMELNYKEQAKAQTIKKVYFSMMSDYNV